MLTPHLYSIKSCAPGRKQTPALPQNFSFSVQQVFTPLFGRPRKLSSNPFRIQFGVRPIKPDWNPPLTKFGEPTDPRQVRNRFGFGRLWRVGLKEILRILQVTESEGPQFHRLIIRLSGVRVLASQHFPYFSYNYYLERRSIVF
jgi:hypothetical protein